MRVDRSLPVRSVGIVEDEEHLRGHWRLRGRPSVTARCGMGLGPRKAANHRGSTAVRCAAVRVSLAARGPTGLARSPAAAEELQSD